MYDLATGRLVASAASPLVASHGATAVDLSPDGSTLAVAVLDRVQRYSTRTLQPQGPAFKADTHRLHDVVYSHDGSLVATASEDGGTIVWDALTGEQLHRYVGGGLSVSFSVDDRTLFTAGGAGLLQAWDVPRASRQLVLGEDTGAVGKEYSLALPAPGGRTVARVRSGMLRFADTRTGRATAAVPTRDETFLWSPDSRWLLSHGPDRVLTVWDASTGSPVAHSSPFGGYFEGPNVAAFAPDSNRVYVHHRTSLHTLSREKLRPVFPSIPTGSDAIGLVPHPVDGTVFVLDWEGSFARVDPGVGEVVDTAPPGLLFAEDTGGVMSPDGTRMVVPGPGRQVRLLDVEEQGLHRNRLRYPVGLEPHVRPRRQPVRPRRRGADPALGRTHRGLPCEPAAAEPDRNVLHHVPGRQQRPGHRLHGRQDLDRADTDRQLGSSCVRDGRTQPLTSRVGAVLPLPAVRGHLPPVAGRNLTLGVRVRGTLTWSEAGSNLLGSRSLSTWRRTTKAAYGEASPGA